METPPTATLDPAPPDAVSAVAFSPTADLLLSATWAGTLSLHNPTTGLLSYEAPRTGTPILSAAWSSTGVAAGLLDGRVVHAPLSETGLADWRGFGEHSSAARSVVALDGRLASGGWDCVLRLWDLRAGVGGVETGVVEVGGKVYGAARCGEHGVVVITSARRVRVVDVRKLGEFVHDKSPPTLALQLRGVSASADGRQYAVGSTEGRVAVEWLDEGRDSFSFKCHRLDGLAFPVNAIAHNDKYGSFATGGGDGHVSFWDGEARKRIAQYPRYPTSVAAIDFDCRSERIAIAVSYTFEEGEKDHPPDEVHIRALDDAHIATRKAKEAPQNETKASSQAPITA